jgi:hypothetical protein
MHYVRGTKSKNITVDCSAMIKDEAGKERQFKYKGIFKRPSGKEKREFQEVCANGEYSHEEHLLYWLKGWEGIFESDKTPTPFKDEILEEMLDEDAEIIEGFGTGLMTVMFNKSAVDKIKKVTRSKN